MNKTNRRKREGTRNRDPHVHTPTDLIKTVGGSHDAYAENPVQTHAGPGNTASISVSSYVLYHVD